MPPKVDWQWLLKPDAMNHLDKMVALLTDDDGDYDSVDAYVRAFNDNVMEFHDHVLSVNFSEPQAERLAHNGARRIETGVQILSETCQNSRFDRLREGFDHVKQGWQMIQRGWQPTDNGEGAGSPARLPPTKPTPQQAASYEDPSSNTDLSQ